MKTRLVFLYVLSNIFFIVLVIVLFKKGDENKVIISKKNDKNIALYMTQNDEIIECDPQYYLLCTVASEMPFNYEYEALKAQTVVARTYLYKKIEEKRELRGDICDSPSHCQNFHNLDELNKIWEERGFSQDEIDKGINLIQNAIESTNDMVIEYNNELIDAVYHASSPYKTEDAKAIWQHKDVPYLKSVECLENEDYLYRYTEKEFTREELLNILCEYNLLNNSSLEDIERIKIADYTDSGRVKSVKIGNNIIAGDELRIILGLNSTDFIIEKGEKIKFEVTGFGHGVGMSQVGANTMAKNGRTYDEIIHKYYTDVDIVDYYNTNEGD